MDPQQILQEIGLSPAESRVYVAALEIGETLHSPLAKRAGVKRATLYYEVLPKLKRKGLITATVKGKRTYLIAQDPQAFLDSRRQQLAQVESIVPELRSLIATAHSKPTLLLYEGVEGIKKVWFDHLVQKESILEFVGIEDIEPMLQKYLKHYYIWERAKRKISVKMLVSGPTVAGIFNVKSDKYELREVKRIDGQLFPIPLSCDIYGDNVSFTLHRKDSEPVGLIIRSKEIAQTMRSLFNAIWASARENGGGEKINERIQ